LLFNRKKPLHDHIVASCPPLRGAIMERVEPALAEWCHVAA